MDFEITSYNVFVLIEKCYYVFNYIGETKKIFHVF